jgi:hypothetical protein
LVREAADAGVVEIEREERARRINSTFVVLLARRPAA